MISDQLRSALIQLAALRINHGERAAILDFVIEEQPIALVYNGVSHAVMMATPSDLDDFARGFSLSEGIVDRSEELSVISVQTRESAVVIEMAISEGRFSALRLRNRSLAGNSACGLCGIESLAAAMRPVPRVPEVGSISPAQIADALCGLAALQVLNQRSGGVHAAAYVHAGGMLVREDVGRHNALDKLIGACALARIPSGFLLLSSRASYELVHKAAMAQFSIVVAISAPTAMAIRLAEEAGITLIAFARGEQMNVYSHARRIL